MAKYKDVDKLMAILENRCNEADNVEAWLAYAIACEDVRDLPAADVAEVRHGRWELYDICSVCGEQAEQQTNYCPNCGSRMDLEGEKE